GGQLDAGTARQPAVEHAADRRDAVERGELAPGVRRAQVLGAGVPVVAHARRSRRARPAAAELVPVAYRAVRARRAVSGRRTRHARAAVGLADLEAVARVAVVARNRHV